MVRLINNQTVLQSELWKSYPWKSFIMKENSIELGTTQRATFFTLKLFKVVILVLFPIAQYYYFLS